MVTTVEVHQRPCVLTKTDSLELSKEHRMAAHVMGVADNSPMHHPGPVAGWQDGSSRGW